MTANLENKSLFPSVDSRRVRCQVGPADSDFTLGQLKQKLVTLARARTAPRSRGRRARLNHGCSGGSFRWLKRGEVGHQIQNAVRRSER